MTLTLDLNPELVAALRAMARQAGLDPDRYIAHTLQEHVQRNQARPPQLSHEESVLLQQLNRGLPEETWSRYHELIAKRQAETLTPDEHAELIALTDDVEAWNVRRLELVAELAKRRNMSLSAMMDALGLTAPPYLRAP